ncbi:hypothetical protein HGM15179_013013 [Zosterops borbonicus]|uniref:NAD(P)(+)--arginine ADP-ribosyltransferase n=1 Tax=Zosterops borbonicus TaxID=364589 RepID=A0A8K1G9J3_9PASS|nr:hypothetical protein HGM15179_013013 [Zosterops borbonicus]
MAPLAGTLALLAMAVATAANKMLTLDMAPNTFDDQYRGCGPAMTAELPALNRSEFQKNPLFARVWKEAMAEWKFRGSRVSPLSSPDQAIALMAYTMDDLYTDFNNNMSVAGRSPQQYRDSFHFKVLHFLLTDALAKLRDSKGAQCQDVFRGVCSYQFQAQTGDTVRFGRFASTSLSQEIVNCIGKGTLFKVNTCQGADIRKFSNMESEEEVLIPPFETFQVTKVTQEGEKTVIKLRSTGTYSKYNCEWLKGGSISIATFHLGGLLLATTALAVATGIL